MLDKIIQAEIIPNEPDTGNAGEGKKNKGLLRPCITSKDFKNADSVVIIKDDPFVDL